MVNKQIIDAGTPKAGPYSHAVRAGDFLFISGQGPAPGTEGIKEQTMSAFENVKTILKAGGADVSKIVKVTVFLNDMGDFGKMNRTYKKFFEQNNVTQEFPARTTVEVANLPAPTMLIEIDVVAAL